MLRAAFATVERIAPRSGRPRSTTRGAAARAVLSASTRRDWRWRYRLVPRNHGAHAHVRAKGSRGSCPVPRSGQAADDQVRPAVRLHRRGVTRVLPKIRKCVPASAFRVEGAVACDREYLCLRADVDVIEAPDWMAGGSSSYPPQAPARRPPPYAAAHRGTDQPWIVSADAGPPPRSRRRAAHGSASRSGHQPVQAPRRRPRRRRLARRRRAEDHPLPVGREVVGRACAGGILTVRPPVGRLEAQKAAEILVRAVGLLVHGLPGLETVFVGGSGPQTERRIRAGSWSLRANSGLRAGSSTSFRGTSSARSTDRRE
jgi:hypothetical protein